MDSGPQVFLCERLRLRIDRGNGGLHADQTVGIRTSLEDSDSVRHRLVLFVPRGQLIQAAFLSRFCAVRGMVGLVCVIDVKTLIFKYKT